jgi:LPXTG-motif cell wall-anchored protein
VLSHLCEGASTPTTTTVADTTTTTVPDTTTTTTVRDTTTTTVPSTSTTTSSTTTTVADTTTTTAPPTTTTTTTPATTTTTTTTTTLPCEWNPQLPAGDPGCVPNIQIASICFDLDNGGEIAKYWHSISNSESVDIEVTWSDGAATIAASSSLIVSSADSIITINVQGNSAATTPQASTEFCEQTIEVEKIVEGPGEASATYTIQVSRLVGPDFLQEGETFQLVDGETKTIPLPSTFNEEGIQYKISEIEAGGANATSVSPDTFIVNGHKGETISITIRNTFASIAIVKTSSATSIQPGQELAYTLVAENTGALTLDPVVIVDRLPPEVIYTDGDYDIVGNAGTCTLEEATRPQLISCELDDPVEPDEFTPAIVIFVTVDPNLVAATPILNQAMSIGTYASALVNAEADSIRGAFGEGRLIQGLPTDLSCNPTEGQVCDLSAKVGVGVDIPATTTTAVAIGGPVTTVVTDGAGATTTVVAELPSTGTDTGRPLIFMGAILLLLGGIMLLSTRRATFND